MSLNSIAIMGRIATDIELRHTQNGVATSTFRVAVDRDFKDRDGNKKTDFLSVVCWRGTAEFISKYMGKGRLVGVTGRLQVRDYTDKDGNKRTVTEIVADNVYFGDSKREEKPLAETDPYYMGPGSYDADEDDIPF